MLRLIFILAGMFLWFSLQGEELKSGDLIFVCEGKSDFSKAISDATAFSDSLKFVHVGIIEIEENKEIMVIEASPEEGVRKITLEKFLESSPQVLYKRLTIDFPVKEVLNNAISYIGQPYDWWYLPDNGKMYCSELIYESYLDSSGNPIFTSNPMNFRYPDGTMPQFWIDLFNELGQPVPEGIPGTNPSDISKSPLLQTLSISSGLSLSQP